MDYKNTDQKKAEGTKYQSRLQNKCYQESWGIWHNDKEDMAIINAYEPNNGAAKYIKQKLMELKGKLTNP